MRPVPLACVVREFWVCVAAGLSPGDAGLAAGVSSGTGWNWFADAGGVKPRFPVEGPRRRPRLNLEEREEISLGVAAQESVREIARRLGRAPSTIAREIRNNSSARRGRYRPQYRFGAQWQGGPQRRPRYTPTAAQARSQRRARRPKLGKLAAHRPVARAGANSVGPVAQPRADRASGCARTFPTIRRCGCRTRPSTSPSTCKDAANCAASCISACAPGARCANLSAAPVSDVDASPTWSTSASAPPRSPTARSLDTGRAI